MNFKQYGAVARNKAVKMKHKQSMSGCKSRVIGSYEFKEQNISIQQPLSSDNNIKNKNKFKNDYKLDKMSPNIIEEEKKEMIQSNQMNYQPVEINKADLFYESNSD